MWSSKAYFAILGTLESKCNLAYVLWLLKKRTTTCKNIHFDLIFGVASSKHFTPRNAWWKLTKKCVLVETIHFLLQGSCFFNVKVKMPWTKKQKSHHSSRKKKAWGWKCYINIFCMNIENVLTCFHKSTLDLTSWFCNVKQVYLTTGKETFGSKENDSTLLPWIVSMRRQKLFFLMVFPHQLEKQLLFFTAVYGE